MYVIRFSALALVLISNLASAQPRQVPSTSLAKARIEVPTIAADPKDVASIDAIVRAFYEVISGPAGQPRQWARDRSLYRPEIRFNIVRFDREGRPSLHTLTHQEFVDSSNDALVKRGFFERELHRVTQRFGNIAHVFSTYEGRDKENGPVIERGINSIQLVYDGTRWWITSASWQDETKDHPIPPEYLPTAPKEPHNE